jgi:hypothetical protein
MKRDIGSKDTETMKIEYCNKELLLKSNYLLEGRFSPKIPI